MVQAKSCSTVLYKRTGKRRKYAKSSIRADVLQQTICDIRTRRAPTRDDNTDFKPIVMKIANTFTLSIVTADMVMIMKITIFG